MATAQPTGYGASNVGLKELMAAGMIKAGSTVYTQAGALNNYFRAAVTQDGSINFNGRGPQPSGRPCAHTHPAPCFLQDLHVGTGVLCAHRVCISLSAACQSFEKLHLAQEVTQGPSMGVHAL